MHRQKSLDIPLCDITNFCNSPPSPISSLPNRHRSARVKYLETDDDFVEAKFLYGDDEWNPRNEAAEDLQETVSSDEEYKPLNDYKKVRRKKTSLRSRNKTTLQFSEKSEYEKMAERNRAERLAFLKSLNINEIKESLCQAVQDLKPKCMQVPNTEPQIEKRTVLPRKSKKHEIEDKAVEDGWRKSRRLKRGNLINLSEEAIGRRIYGKDFPSC